MGVKLEEPAQQILCQFATGLGFVVICRFPNWALLWRVPWFCIAILRAAGLCMSPPPRGCHACAAAVEVAESRRCVSFAERLLTHASSLWRSVITEQVSGCVHEVLGVNPRTWSMGRQSSARTPHATYRHRYLHGYGRCAGATAKTPSLGSIAHPSQAHAAPQPAVVAWLVGVNPG